MTIRETLKAWREARIAKLTEELHAPQSILDYEKESLERGFNHIVGMDKFGDLEVRASRNLLEGDENECGFCPLVKFECVTYHGCNNDLPMPHEILMFTKVDKQPMSLFHDYWTQRLISLSRISVTELVELEWSV